MVTDFELAYFLFLTGRNYRAKMIECGVTALCLDVGVDNAALLAGADHESSEDLVSLFRQTASELNIVLPSAPHEPDWIAFCPIEFHASGLVKLPADPHQRLLAHLAYFTAVMRASRQKEACRFGDHLTWFVSNTTGDYETWFSELTHLESLVSQSDCSSAMKALVDELSKLIAHLSYGGTTTLHLETTEKLVAEIGATHRRRPGLGASL